MSSIALPQGVPSTRMPRPGATSVGRPGLGAAGVHGAGFPVAREHCRSKVAGDRGADLPSTSADHWSRLAVAAVSVVAIVVILTMGLRMFVAQQASAAVVDRVGGHVLIEPGERLADVAARTVPAGVDPVAHLDAVTALNARSETTAGWPRWSVVLLPAY
ncbi:MAG: hypothetical protein WD358_02485 [Nitriliruptoraceae bacterium]